MNKLKLIYVHNLGVLLTNTYTQTQPRLELTETNEDKVITLIHNFRASRIVPCTLQGLNRYRFRFLESVLPTSQNLSVDHIPE